MSIKRALVTGTSGHIGFHVAAQLLKLGHEVVLLIRTENKNIEQLKNSGAQIQVVNLQNPETYQDQLEHIDVLFHIASGNTTSAKNEEQIVENTYKLTRTVIDTALAKNVKTIVYTSSVVVLGRSKSPNVLIDESSKNDRANTVFESPYVKGKFLAEEYCDQLIREKQVDIRRIYPSWVLGNHNLKVTPPQQMIKDYFKNGQWFYFNGGISVASVKSVAKAHIDAWLKGRPNEKYITAGNNISFKTFYNTLAKCTGYVKPFIYLPKPLIYFVSLFVKKFFKNRDIVSPKYVSAVIGHYSWYSSEKAVRELGYVVPKLETILNVALAEARGNNQKN